MRFLPRGLLRVVLVLVLLAGTLAGPASATATQATPGAVQSVGFEVALQPDGDAVWTVTTRIPLESESDVAAFRELAASFERGDDVSFSADVFRGAAAAASRATGRQMAIQSVSRTSAIETAGTGNQTGRLTLQVVWTNFARTADDRLIVGDAFNTTNGTWFPRLGAGQTLVIRPPPNHNVVSAPIGPEAGVLRWEGPATFEPGYLTITYEQSGLGLSTEILAGLAALVVVLAVGLGLWSRRGGLRLPSGAEAEAADAPPAESAADPVTAEADTAGAADADEALLSDEERVERLLVENGGRMKQARIVKETGWSNAKVSQLLSAMDEDGRVDKLRIGRENLISLPDEDVGNFE